MDTSQISELVGGFLTTLKPDSIADYMAYLIFLLALITSATLPDDNAQASNLLTATMLLAIFEITVGQTWAVSSAPLEKAFPAYLARIGLFLLPFIAAGSVRVRGKKGRFGLPLSVVIGILGVLYAVGSFVVPALMGLREIA
jgi:hypothetical protein